MAARQKVDSVLSAFTVFLFGASVSMVLLLVCALAARIAGS